MDILWNVMMIVHAVVAVCIIFLVLLQQGKGADMGAAFGGGSSGSLFGATGSANFLSRTTAILATVFFVTSLSMAYIATHKPRGGAGGVMEGVTSKPAAPVPGAPVVPASAASTLPAAPAGAPSPAAIPGQDTSKPAAPAADVPAPSSSPAPADASGSKSSQIPK